MVLFALAMQLAFWGLGAHALEAAVAEGGVTARAEAGSASQALALVQRDAKSFGGAFLVRPQVTAQGGPDDFVSISARAAVPSIVPGLDLAVEATSYGPRQQFRASG